MRLRELRVSFAHKIAQSLVARRQAKQGGSDVAANWGAYADWRETTLRKILIEGFGADFVKGKVALDFGCGDGALCTALMDLGAESAHGVDLDQAGLERFAERLRHYTGPRKPTFSRSTSPKRIDEPDQKFDVIYCFDVLEHVMDYRENIFEWHRVLKPRGSVCIYWQPYWHPYGHHAHDWIPIPWAHVFLNDAEVLEVCARIVDWDGFAAPIWDRNHDGTKKNRFRAARAGENFLNKLTTAEFERICREAGFTFARREFKPFQIRQPAKAVSSLMTRLPMARDFFTAFALYELSKAG
jgi:SAM-dependent methyltransferase